ncbi:efflux RND transporter permease subunit [Accumulibacter sp.]|uniref:efflux RND transporter permease subunit n=1 Tax=Accumulibacter sp. TaxID=2053492 RepID=UPI002CC4918B|nr:efflux RND transporter permease subunit [Accumulibacter sp.]HNG88310.1 efflux RND transporter permease subunit [Accumulibacter sp.]
MIANLIRWSIANRVLVLLATLVVAAAGTVAMLRTPVDAIPDLSDVQVIIRTTYAGQSPRVVEDQVTYPLTTTMMSVPGAKAVRGFSFFGDSFVYVLFEDGTDLYWARSRVLEYLNQAQSRLPAGVRPELGPDATGVGWIYQYALIDRSGRLDLAQLRALQDWFLKYELRSVPNVAEVASVGGMVKTWQIVVDPDKLRGYKLPLAMVVDAVKRANAEAGGSAIEMGEAEYMVRATGYLKSADDFRAIPVGGEGTTPVLLGDVARIQAGPQMRRGIAELDGEGEVAGGVIVMRSGKNARETIELVKARLEALKPSLPKGVEIVPVYDRSGLIERAIDTLKEKLVEEFIVVAVVCALFLMHLRSSLVAILSLPVGVLVAFIVMRVQGINANIMSLGGIAIAIGAMLDAAIVMIENAHKHLEHWRRDQPDDAEPDFATRARLIADAAAEVGPALFFSLLIITLSFLPVFTLEAQEGRLFAPLAWTKTWAMAAAAGLSVTLVPVLMLWFIRGRIRSEESNPLNRWLIAAYQPLLRGALAQPWLVVGLAVIALAATLWPARQLGSEFMPPLDEGDLLYMPTTLPGIGPGKAAELLQQTDRIIKSFPEVARVFGKVGRAESATDPAPLEMIETTIQFRPRTEWRPGMTLDKLIAEMDAATTLPGLSNVWVQPIRNRIDMLATGIKSPVGIKVAGADLAEIDRLAARIEQVVKTVPGATSVLAERLGAGRYVEIRIRRLDAARYGLSVADLQEVVSLAVGGENIGETIEGLERFPINVRYPRELRDSLAKLKALPIVTARGATITLDSVADVVVADGPPMIKSENARPSGWIYVDLRGRDIGRFVQEAKQRVRDEVQLTPGYSIAWSGQYEYLERAEKRMALVVPATLAIILVLLYLIFRNFGEALLVMAAVPFALIGGVWLLWALGHNLSIASAVGFIALAGVAAEFGVVMLIYLDSALREARARYAAEGKPFDRAALVEAIMQGATQRVRPKSMTVAVILAGLAPIMVGSGTGSEIMQRIAAPMVGGMVSAPLLSMLLMPVAYLLMQRRKCDAGEV